MAIRGGPSTKTSPKERRLIPERVDWLLDHRNIQSKNSAWDATLKRVRDEKNTKIAHMMEAMAVGSPFSMNSGRMSSRSMNLGVCGACVREVHECSRKATSALHPRPSNLDPRS